MKWPLFKFLTLAAHQSPHDIVKQSICVTCHKHSQPCPPPVIAHQYSICSLNNKLNVFVYLLTANSIKGAYEKQLPTYNQAIFPKLHTTQATNNSYIILFLYRRWNHFKLLISLPVILSRTSLQDSISPMLPNKLLSSSWVIFCGR